MQREGTLGNELQMLREGHVMARVQFCPMRLQDVCDWNTHEVSLHCAFSKPSGCLRMITEDSVSSGDTGGRKRIAEVRCDFDKLSSDTRLSHPESNCVVVPCCDAHSIWCHGIVDCVVPVALRLVTMSCSAWTDIVDMRIGPKELYRVSAWRVQFRGCHHFTISC